MKKIKKSELATFAESLTSSLEAVTDKIAQIEEIINGNEADESVKDDYVEEPVVEDEVSEDETVEDEEPAVEDTTEETEFSETETESKTETENFSTTETPEERYNKVKDFLSL